MTLHVINPNSSAEVTAGITEALAPLQSHCSAPIKVHLLREGPPGIETQAHVDGVVAPLLQFARSLEADASAFVIACFSDPGLAAMREQSTKPVLGIAESAVLTAMSLGQRFGIISILPGSIPRHMRYLGAMGVLDRLAGDVALGLGVGDLADRDRTYARMVDRAKQLTSERGADVLILGCAGMARYARDLEAEIGCPVVEPCQAATAMAIGRIAYSAIQD